MNERFRELIREGFTIPEVKRDVPLWEAVSIATKAVANHLKGSQGVIGFLNTLPKGLNSCCPDSPIEELHRQVYGRYGQIDRSDVSVMLGFNRDIMRAVAEFEREVIWQVVSSIDDITEDERQIFYHGIKIAKSVDVLYLKWCKEVSVPYLSQSEEKRKQLAQAFRSIFNEYDYTVLRGGNRLALATAFPSEIKAVVGGLNELRKSINDEQLRSYLKVWADAYSCEDISMLEEMWVAVDRAWIRIPSDCRIFPAHAIEATYEHPNCVSPDFKVMLRLDIGRKDIENVREMTIVVAEEMGDDSEVIKRKLQLIDIGVFFTPIWAGRYLGKRISGQSTPNRQKVQAEGGRIIIDYASIVELQDILLDALRKHCTKRTFKLLKKYINVESSLIAVITHECFHPVGRSEETDKAVREAIDSNEESKATCGGLVVLERIVEDSERLKLIKISMISIIRKLCYSFRSNAAAIGYVRTAKALCHYLHANGVLRVNGGLLDIDVKRAKDPRWVESLREYTKRVMIAYKEHDNEVLWRIHDEYAEDPFILEVIHVLDRE